MTSIFDSLKSFRQRISGLRGDALFKFTIDLDNRPQSPDDICIAPLTILHRGAQQNKITLNTVNYVEQ